MISDALGLQLTQDTSSSFSAVEVKHWCNIMSCWQAAVSLTASADGALLALALKHELLGGFRWVYIHGSVLINFIALLLLYIDSLYSSNAEIC